MVVSEAEGGTISATFSPSYPVSASKLAASVSMSAVFSGGSGLLAMAS